jgi:hypothetical protein
MDADTIEQALEVVPDRPLSSLYDVACLYAACDVYDRYTSEYVDWDISPKALRAMSPQKLKSESLLEPEAEHSLIAARIDLSGPSPKLADPPVVVENLTEDLKYKIGFMSRKKTSAQTDYSISNFSNGDDVETLAYDSWGNRFLRGRLERWPFEVADEVVEEYPILQNLRTLGEDTSVLEQLEESLLNLAPFESTKAIVTVKVKLEPEGDFLYPGEVPALNEAGVSNRFEHLCDGMSVDNAHGPGTGYVSGERGEVVGGSTGIRGQYGKLQTGRFPNMQSNDAWMSRPVREAQAEAIATFDGFVGEFSFVRQGVRLHYLPYPTQRVDSDLFQRFYQDVYRPLREADDSEYVSRLIELYTAEISSINEEDEEDILSQLVDDETSYEQFTDTENWLRLYGLMYVGSTDPSRVFVDEPSVSLEALAKLEDAYVDVMADIGSSSLFGKIAEQMDYHLPTEDGIVHSVMFGSFFERVTAASPDEADNAGQDQQATTDDTLFSRYAKLLRGTAIPVSKLIEEYATLLTREFRSNQNEGRDSVFPSQAVVAQYIQLRALNDADLLDANNIMSEGICGDSMESLVDETTYNSREERLDDFISNHPMLNDAEARSTFLLGALVGRLSAYQYNENVSQKLTEQYPPSSINRRSIPEVTQDVLDRNYTYGDKEEISGFNHRYTDRLTDSMLVKSPSEWGLTESEVKWIYALGIAYGKQDTSEGIEREENDIEK